eukprot:305603-Amphidinium_carterae.1
MRFLGNVSLFNACFVLVDTVELERLQLPGIPLQCRPSLRRRCLEITPLVTAHSVVVAISFRDFPALVASLATSAESALSTVIQLLPCVPLYWFIGVPADSASQ